MNQTYTLNEVSEILKVSRRTVLRYVKDRKIKAFKFGNYYRVTKEQLDIFMADNTLKEEDKQQRK